MQNIAHAIGTFIKNADETVLEIIADILSCFVTASTKMNTNMTKLFDEVKKCATSN